MTARLLRSHLYVPGDQERFLVKARTLDADAVILDLEDAVAPDRKDLARSMVLDHLGAPEPGPERWVRVNTGARGLADIVALAPAHPDGVWLPKAEPGGWMTDALAALDEAGIRPGLLIESAAGLVGLPQLPELPAHALTQLGEVDLAADLRMRDRSEEAMVPFRARIVLETAIRGLEMPVAPVSESFSDLEDYRIRSVQLRDRGFGSRACIHPAQLGVVNAVFDFPPDELADARALVARFEENKAAGRGVFRDGEDRMVDLATVRWAQDLVRRFDGRNP